MELVEIWADLPQEIKNQFETQSKSIELKRGEFIYYQGDEPKGIYFVKRGLVGLVLMGSTSGHEHLLRFFKQGQYFGHRSLFSEEGYHGSTLALEPTLLKLVPKKLILDVMEQNPHMYKDVLKVVSKELRRCEVQHVMILENQILGRVAQALVYLKELHPEHNWTRQEIANFCASTVSTVIKTMAQLEEMGLISQNGRAIEIRNRDGLLALQD